MIDLVLPFLSQLVAHLCQNRSHNGIEQMVALNVQISGLRSYTQRQNEIYYASAHKTQKRNEMSCYENSLQDIKTMLKKNTGYMPSEQFRRLQDDIRNYLDKSL